ncbi:MAG: hypothetical protein M1830_007647 [Pleopsidium flavum]|nr:MAG: hypothetical protein M1830_007647 [Pleopsidium flavum]
MAVEVRRILVVMIRPEQVRVVTLTMRASDILLVLSAFEKYADGEIVRAGAVGDQGDGAFSTGRGGAANIGSPGMKPTMRPHDEDAIPETAIREDEPGNYHVGRGGEGNIHKEKSTTHEGLADKLKHKIFPKKEGK